ncbi:hypothetical protein [Cerasicoccus frondis]|uniref:hypothetical protein n=1 Tax=Cerasicoccus frondis TaxID=490090 RepID=UPI00285274F4|nr:hypothetical protein [Cerasicoccus frondis]
MQKTLSQPRRFKPSYIFEHDGKVLKVISKRFFSTNSFEIKIKELSSNRIENSSFAIGYLLAGILSLLILAACIAGILNGGPADDDAAPLFVMTIFPLVIAIMCFVSFWKKTYSYVMLYREDNGVVAVSFYPDTPSREIVDEYIDELKSIIDGEKGIGF